MYRRAVQLEPNIEFRYYQANKNNSEKKDEKKNKSSSKKQQEEDGKIEHEIEDLVESFSKELSLENRPICQSASSADVIRTEKHISSLPIEVLLLILKFVVSNDLDMKSLERFGRTCKGFFLLSRENEIWRKACEKVWKNNLSPPPLPPLMTWRDIFMNRCRIMFEGCYISKITYQRLGENSFQDQFYRPVQIVEYFRLIRFFPSGDLIMLTSADELQNSVNKLRNKRLALQSREVLRGNYHYQDDHVLILIKRRANFNLSRMTKKRTVENDDNSLTFFLELEICSTSKRKFSKLMWKSYSVSQVKNGEELTSDYDLRSTTKYPPFFFSHVKSYHSQSNECLQ